MAFRFTEEDFRRYVKKSEHGGVHIWHELMDDSLPFGSCWKVE